MRQNTPYKRLVAMLILSFISMYVLMYAMVNTFSNVFANINQFYMAGLMTAPMALIELWLMKSMYTDKKKNLLIAGFSVFAILLFLWGIRTQSGVGDEQFLRSMIPHHAGAILMCNEADIRDTDIQKLCESIVESQQSEIDWMKKKLNQLE